MNYYERIGVPRTSSTETIKKAYRKKAKKTHSDVGGNDAEMRDLNAAYSCLSDPERKRLYDACGCDEQQATLRQRCEATLVTLFKDFIQRGVPPHDVLGEIEDDIRGKMSNAKQAIDNGKKKQAEWEKYRLSVVPKNGSAPIFALSVDDLIAQLQQQINQAQDFLKTGELMLEILREYRCGLEQEMPGIPIYRGSVFGFSVDAAAWKSASGY